MSKIFSSIFASQEKIEKWAIGLEIASLILVAVTIFLGSLVIKFRKESSRIDKKEKDALNLTIANLDSSSRKLENDNLKLQIELGKLKLALGDRFIPPLMFSEIKTELKKYKGRQVKFNIIGMNEVVAFANSMQSLFSQSSWKSLISNISGSMSVFGAPASRGIMIKSFGDINKNVAKFLHAKFTSFGYLCQNTSADENGIDLEITIASK